MTPVAPAIEVDAVVIGAGPAGCALALNLAPFRRVLVVDRIARPVSRTGECMPAAAGRLLRDMGLLDDFRAQGHAPCHAQRSFWGGPEIQELDATRNLDGHGWHIDRPRFDRWLRETAMRRGAAFIAQSCVPTARRRAGPDCKWEIGLERDGKPLLVRSPLLVDATGRSASVARQAGSKRRMHDKLACGWIRGRDSEPGSAGELHAEAGGWWYSSSFPGSGRIVAFYTDADLPEVRSAHSRDALLARIATIPRLREQLGRCGFVPGGHGFCAAQDAALDRPIGDGWLAAGDAAMSFDPLSSQGLFNALYTGLAGAEAADSHLQGDPAALARYAAALSAIRHAYATHLDAWYRLETRWSDRPFWRRRHGGRDSQALSRLRGVDSGAAATGPATRATFHPETPVAC